MSNKLTLDLTTGELTTKTMVKKTRTTSYVLSKVFGYNAEEHLKYYNVKPRIFQDASASPSELYNTASNNVRISFDTISVNSNVNQSYSYEDVNVYIGCYMKDGVHRGGHNAKRIVMDLAEKLNALIKVKPIIFKRLNEINGSESIFTVTDASMLSPSIVPIMDPNIQDHWSVTLTIRGIIPQKMRILTNVVTETVKAR